MNFDGKYKDFIKPDKIHVLSISIFLKALQDTPGGVAANIAYSLSLFGEKPVLLGSVGKDATSYIQSLKKRKIDTSSIHYSKLPTASFNVITDMDDNQVGGFYPGAMFDSASLKFSPWKGKDVFVVISPHDPVAMKRQVEECKKYKFRLFYDVGQQVSNIPAEDIVRGVVNAEVLIVNDYELSVLCEKTQIKPEKLKTQVPIVITTLGKKGSIIEGKNVPNPIHIGIAKPNEIVDPTGAGDAYRAGFLYGYVRGYDLKICGQMGALSAVYAVEKRGTQEHTFSVTAFKKRYKENFGETLTLQ
jgi:adenosine kinase